jgi:hypothetical protein
VRADGARFEVSGVDGPRIPEVDVSFAAVEQSAQPPPE